MEKSGLQSICVRLEDAETGKTLLEKMGKTVLVVTSDAEERDDGDANMRYSFCVQGDLGELAMVFATHPRGLELMKAALTLRLSMETEKANVLN